jgi:hypothetical protein
MYTGQPEKYISTVFAFGEKTPLTANANQVLKGYLAAPGGAATMVTTGTLVEFAVAIPRNGILKNLYWSAEASTLVAVGNSLTVYVKDPPTAAASAPTGLAVTWNGNVKSGSNVTNTVPVVAGDTVSILLQLAKGSGTFIRPRVTIELEADTQYPNPWDLTGPIVSYLGGNVGIGTPSPVGELHVKNAAAAGIAGVFETLATGKIISGIVGATEKFSVKGNGDVYASGKVGIGTAPTTDLDVNGTVQMQGIRLPTNAGNGLVLTSDALGNGTWAPTGGGSGGIDGSGTVNAIAKFIGATTIDDSVIFQNGSNIGIGTQAPGSTLEVNGTVQLGGNAVTPGAYVDLAGKVGIGTTTPQSPLAVKGSNEVLALEGSGITWMSYYPHGRATPSDVAWTGYKRGNMEFSIGNSVGEIGLIASMVSIEGNLLVTGTKNFVQDHPTNPTKEILYVSLEGGEAGTYYRGMGKLVNGKAVIDLSGHFDLVTNEESLTIQLTPRGEWLQLYVAKLTTKELVVEEAQSKSGQFDYFVQGVRKGYENHQVIRDKRNVDVSRPEMHEAVASAI